MTEEHKEKLRIGRENAKKGIKKVVVEKPKVERQYKPLTEEHKAKLRAGREKAKLEGKVRKPRVTKEKKDKAKFSNKRITIILSGKETNSFDFYAPIREAYRSAKNYKDISKILKEISNSVWNTNPHKIIELLHSYCEVTYAKQ